MKDDRIIDSHSLTEEVNLERKREGKPTFAEKNMGSTNYTRQDGSYRTAAGFFRQLFSKKEKENEE